MINFQIVSLSGKKQKQNKICFNYLMAVNLKKRKKKKILSSILSIEKREKLHFVVKMHKS
jgi:hypothetical protein